MSNLGTKTVSGIINTFNFIHYFREAINVWQDLGLEGESITFNEKVANIYLKDNFKINKEENTYKIIQEDFVTPY